MVFLRDVFSLRPTVNCSRRTVVCAGNMVINPVNSRSRSLILKYISRFSSNKTVYPLHVLFFGTDSFAVENLKTLYHELKFGKTLSRLDVVTSSKQKNCIVRKYSYSTGLNVLDWPLKKCPSGYDIGLVASFGHLIPEKVIKSFPHGILNVHASLLPRWRGAAPIIHAIMNGDEKTGVSIMRIMPKRFDIGDVLAQSQVAIEPHETSLELSKKLAVVGGKLLVRCLQSLPESLENAKPQSESGITYAPKVNQSHGFVKWQEKDAKSLYNLWRALSGIYHLTAIWHGTQVRLVDACCCDNESTQVIEPPGLVKFSKSARMIMVACADGRKVGFRKIGVSGKKIMSAEDFYNGYMSKKSVQEWYFT